MHSGLRLIEIMFVTWLLRRRADGEIASYVVKLSLHCLHCGPIRVRNSWWKKTLHIKVHFFSIPKMLNPNLTYDQRKSFFKKLYSCFGGVVLVLCWMHSTWVIMHKAIISHIRSPTHKKMRRSKNNHFLKLDPPRTQANIKRVSIFQPHHRGNTTDETSKTEVLQTPSATEVNLAQG